jgi:predicted outer membrane repeat protein
MLLVLWLGSVLSAQASRIYVNSAAAGANNGTSWANAYASLQSALAAAVSGDEIWVAAGVYKPSVQVDVDASGGSDTREATFQLPNGVKIYGGFAGTEATLAERNWTVNVTILSGDIDNNDVNADANFIAETDASIVGNNAYHVVYTANVTAATQLDGFVITAGRAYLAAPPNPNVPNLDGGGWYNRIGAPQNASSPTIRNCTFQGNYAESEGAGFYTTPGTVYVTMESEIRACTFVQNRSKFSGGAIFLGSFVAGNYHPVIAQCEFTGNQAYRRGGAISFIGDNAQLDTCTFRNNQVTVVSGDGSTLPGSGGGVNMVASKADFRRCMFIGNSATGNPTGAFEGGGGGAVYMSTNEPQTDTFGQSQPTFTGCGFYGNTAQGNTMAWGGAAVHLNDGGRLSVTYVNCVFAGNSAQHDGGAVANFTRVIGEPGFTPALQTAFTNCTFSNNSAGRFGGGVYNDGYLSSGVEVLNTQIENSILHGNTAVTNGPQVYNDGTVCTVSYSLVQGSGGSGGGWNATVGTDGGNNIASSPNFVNAADPDGADNIPGTNDDGLRVQMSSPAINGGNSGVANLIGVTTDFAGDARFLGSRVDMGAYERTSFIIPNLKIYWLYPWRIVRPVCLSCPWAIRLNMGINEKPQHFSWQSDAQFRDYGDYAEVVGTIASQENRSVQFEVYLKLEKPQDWKSWSSQQRTYNAETIEAQKVARRTHPDWTYWLLSDESYLKGKGTVEGTLQLHHAPNTLTTGFQFGIGANAQDADLGLSGEFYYRGTVQYKGVLKNRVALKGVGSLNVDAKLCEQDCDLRAARVSSEPERLESAPTLRVYPNPAREWITVEGSAENSYTIQLYNLQGQRLQPIIREVQPGQKQVNVKGFAPGLYYLRLTDDMGNTQQYKVIVQE